MPRPLPNGENPFDPNPGAYSSIFPKELIDDLDVVRKVGAWVATAATFVPGLTPYAAPLAAVLHGSNYYADTGSVGGALLVGGLELLPVAGVIGRGMVQVGRAGVVAAGRGLALTEAALARGAMYAKAYLRGFGRGFATAVTIPAGRAPLAFDLFGGLPTALVRGSSAGHSAGIAAYEEMMAELARLAAARSSEAALLLPYGIGSGHHIPAKSAFAGMLGYDAESALAIPISELVRLNVYHPAVTGAQMTAYKAFAKTGETLTWEVMERIETQALIRGGMEAETARLTVQQAIQSLKSVGIPGPVRIPWII